MRAAQAKTALALTPADPMFIAAVIDETTRESVRGAAKALGWQNPSIREGGIAVAAAIAQTADDVGFVVVDVSDSSDPASEIAGLREICGPHTPILALGLVNDVRLFRSLRDAGIDDYLVKPLATEALTTAIRGASHTQPPDPASAKAARIISFLGSRGGVGTTTLAVSAAWTIASHQDRAILLDLDLQLGSAALSLDLEPSRGLRELFAHPERIDSLLIDAAATQVGDRFRVLSAEEPLEDLFQFGPEGLTAVVHHLKAAADVVLLDVPRSLTPVGRQALMMSDMVCIVTDLSLPAMRDTQRLLALIQGLQAASKPCVIANRVGGVGGEVGVGDFESALGLKLAHVVPYDRIAATAAAETAKPFVEVARNPKTAAALRKMALALISAEDTPTQTSLLKRVLGR
jgi:pilus assembly protein CpaE